MKFPPLTIEQLLGELTELEADWQDATSAEVIGTIAAATAALRAAATIDVSMLMGLLTSHEYALDVLRLLRVQSQEAFVSDLREAAGVGPTGFVGWRSWAKRHPEIAAEALLKIGVAEEAAAQVRRTWTLEEVLAERYRLGRGRAIAGQARGRALEDVVQTILETVGASFERGVTFTGVSGVTAKADFAIPDRTNVKIVIEVKAFEATGSKQTDVIGDIGKIGAAKGSQRYFFIVTDGRGWLRRVSDLQQILSLYEAEVVDNVYTRARLAALASDVDHILRHEM
ncbi:MAG: DpnII family type II restriction endonuclease [Gaiellaceae bacterium]